MADGLDDETWEFHRCNGDYSRWFREHLGDDELVAEAAEVESSRRNLAPVESRRTLREAIERRYPTGA